MLPEVVSSLCPIPAPTSSFLRLGGLQVTKDETHRRQKSAEGGDSQPIQAPWGSTTEVTWGHFQPRLTGRRRKMLGPEAAFRRSLECFCSSSDCALLTKRGRPLRTPSEENSVDNCLSRPQGRLHRERKTRNCELRESGALHLTVLSAIACLHRELYT